MVSQPAGEPAAPDAATAAKALSLSDPPLHTSAGHVGVAWTVAAEGAIATVSGGADGRLVIQQLKPSQQLKAAQAMQGPIHALVLNPEGTLAAMADGQRVKAVSIPELAIKEDITRFTAPACCFAWAKDGRHLAAGADDGAVKLITTGAGSKPSVRCTLRTEGYVRGLALDPDGKFLAAANADGSVLLWALGVLGPAPAAAGASAGSSGSSSNTLEKSWKKLGGKLNHGDLTARQGLAWHPEGTVLAVAGPDSDVILLERYSWKEDGFLSGGHTGHVGVVAFSPNGIYVATAGSDSRVVVWHVGRREQVSSRSLPAPASSLAWHNKSSMLLVGCSSGSTAIWTFPVPEGERGLDSPWKPVDEMLAEADRAAAAAAAAATSAGGDEEDDDFLEDDMGGGDDQAAAAGAGDADDDEDGALFGQRRGVKRHQHAPGGGAAAPADSAGAGIDAVLAASAAAGGYRPPQPPPQYLTALALPKPKKPQRPIQPGSTPASSSSSDGSSSIGSGGARFLAYNRLGCVVSKAVDDHHVVEVSFLDTAKHRLRVPNLTDYYGFTAAGLGPRGVAYISPAAEHGEGEEATPSMLVYRGFDSWASGSDWTVALPAGEEAAVVAAGASCVAVGTSKQLLRLYSLAGRQLAVMSLPGPPVALVAAGPVVDSDGGLASAAQHHLAVVWATGPPEPLANTQQLAYRVYDVARCCACYEGDVTLSPGCSLAWLNFSREGCLAAMDSAGTLRLRTPDWGGAWVPVLDAAAAKASVGAAKLWPVWLDAGALTAVATTAKAPYPQVLPRPLLSPVPLSLPLAPADGGAVAEEEAVLRAGLLAAHVKSLEGAAGASDGADGDRALASEVQACDVECDKKALPLFLEYVKAGKQARALEVVGGLNLVKSIEGALRLANRQHSAALAERIQAFLEQRLEWEEAQAAAAAQRAAAEEPYAGHAYAGGAAAGAAGDDDDMEVQQDQASQFVAAGSGTAAAAAAGAAAAAAPIFGAAAAGGGARARPAAGAAGGAAGGGGLKRKPTAADIGGAGGAGAGGKAGGGGSNPFARKKVVR